MREVVGSTPGLDFYLLCEPICVSLHVWGDIKHWNTPYTHAHTPNSFFCLVISLLYK
jgi:hypothetical protein